MNHNFTQRRMAPVRRALRKTMSGAEIKLWSLLRRRQVCDCKFRRQHGVGAVVFDFYCVECRLAIEVDGDYHNARDVVAHDQARDATVARFGIETLRFTNDDIVYRAPAVIEAIANAITRRRSPSPIATVGTTANSRLDTA